MTDADKTIENARKFAAETWWRIAAESLFPGYGFAQHVKHAQKLRYMEDAVKTALMIEAGELDHVLAVKQQMHYFMTGEIIPIMPPL